MFCLFRSKPHLITDISYAWRAIVTRCGCKRCGSAQTWVRLQRDDLRQNSRGGALVSSGQTKNSTRICARLAKMARECTRTFSRSLRSVSSALLASSRKMQRFVLLHRRQRKKQKSVRMKPELKPRRPWPKHKRNRTFYETSSTGWSSSRLRASAWKPKSRDYLRP